MNDAPPVTEECNHPAESVDSTGVYFFERNEIVWRCRACKKVWVSQGSRFIEVVPDEETGWITNPFHK
jgi:hypothetical protein